MKTYNVRITETAFKDLYAVKNHIANKLCSPDTANQQIQRITQKIFSLKTFPERHPVLFQTGEQKFYRILADNYSVIYTIKQDIVTVIRIAYTSCDLLQLFDIERS